MPHAYLNALFILTTCWFVCAGVPARAALSVGGSSLRGDPADSPSVAFKNTFNAETSLRCERVLHQLTGLTPALSGIDFGDPSAPTFDALGVHIYTTGGGELTWSTAEYGPNAQRAFAMGQPPSFTHLKLFHADLTPFQDEANGEDLWDPTIELDPQTGTTILYGGAMTRFSSDGPGWPDDNWSRRIYAFRKDGHKWIMNADPFIGPRPHQSAHSTPTWEGHSYGHHFLYDDDGQNYVFYERVSEEKNGMPWKTEIFARNVSPQGFGSGLADGAEIPIIQIPKSHPWPEAKRESGGTLVEGPHVFKWREFYILFFSSGDYTSDEYGINAAWSRNAMGPYHPYLEKDGHHLINFADRIQDDNPLVWGPARANLFEMDGSVWAVLHGIEKAERPADPDHGFRNVYLAPVRIELDPATGAPDFEILPRTSCD